MSECYSYGPDPKAVPLIFIQSEELAVWLADEPESTKRWVKSTGFLAKPDTFCLIPDNNSNIRQVLVGCADINTFWNAGTLAASLPAGVYRIEQTFEHKVLASIVLAWGLGAYQFKRYKTLAKTVAQLVIPASLPQDMLRQLVDSIYNIRDLINTPAENMGPAELADVARQLAITYAADFEEVIGDQLLAQAYPAIHAVGRASNRAPRLIDFRWGKPSAPKVTLVGKGVCFDSGGLDIKPSSGMLLMKKDMGGAAHVLGLARLIMGMQLPINLRVLIPAVENAISGNAYRPGDIITTRKGLTVEIGNTDAEGRVILADALTAAAAEQPELIIDFATLTGAARVALGTDIPALFTSSENVAAALLESAAATQDPLWRLPLYEPYRDLISSNIADINNSSASGYAGAITAALFLKEFIPPEQLWIHIDLMAWNLNSRPGRPEGGEAMALRAIFHFLQQRFVEH